MKLRHSTPPLALRQPPRHGRGQRVQSMLLAGSALFFVPHAGKIIPKHKTRSIEPMHVASLAMLPIVTPLGVITTDSAFRLAPDMAFDDLIREAAKRYSVSADLVKAVVRAESAFDPRAVSRVGARGLMQLMPALAKELGVTDPFDPRQNIMAGTRYLSKMLSLHNGNVVLALASYNAGPGNVDRYNGVPPFPETKHYIKTITESLEEP